MEGHISPVSSADEDDAEIRMLLHEELQFDEVDINIHFHCEHCIKIGTCNVWPKPGFSCEIINCPQNCGMRFHACKLDEHNLLCTKVRVPCLNAGYGCPHWMPRLLISQHLPKCPASVVVCCYERNRWLVGARGRESVAPPKGFMANFNPQDLDVSLVLHDQALANQLSDATYEVTCSSVANKRFPVLPLQSPVTGVSHAWHHFLGKRSGSLATDEEDLVPGLSGSVHAMLKKPGDNSGKNDANPLDNYFEGLCSHGIHRTMCRLCKDDAPPSNVVMKKVWRQELVEDPEGGKCVMKWKQQEVIAKIRRRGPFDSYHFCRVDDSDEELSSLSTNSTSVKNARFISRSEINKRFKSVNAPQLDAKSVKMELTFENYSKHQVKPRNLITIQCLQVFRRDEFASHYKTVHCDLLGDGLQGKLHVKRCPMMALGCPYSTVIRTPAPLEGEISFCPQLQAFGFKPGSSSSPKMNGSFKDSLCGSFQSSLIVPTPFSCRAPSPLSREESPDLNEKLLYRATPHLLGLPLEVLHHILSFLDGFSLSEVALTCSELNTACELLVKEKGIVLQYWHRQEEGKWKAGNSRWAFSSSFGNIEAWQLKDNNTSDIAHHMQTCKYFDRQVASEKFSYGLLSSTHLRSHLNIPMCPGSDVR